MNCKHTPGEWTLFDNKIVWTGIDGPALPICEIAQMLDSDSEEENEANASLIVSAPKLLEAVNMAYTAIVQAENPTTAMLMAKAKMEWAVEDIIG